MFRAVCLLSVGISLAWSAVFVERRGAHQVLRVRRANTGFLEELKAGNIERECMEEICNYEEAREAYEDDDKTIQFWKTYRARDPCEGKPCLNNGICVHVDTSFECRCAEGFEGRYCQMVFEDSLKCLYLNGGCEHFCDGSGPRRRCSCAEGFSLGDDERQCVAQVEYPCGVVPGQNESIQIQTRLVGSNHCPRGDCPWQVLVEYKGESHCGGVLVQPDWVLTAAHCVHGKDPNSLYVLAGEHTLDMAEGTEQSIPVAMAISHQRYSAESGVHGDVALLRLARPVVLGPMAVPICLPQRDLAERELLATRHHTVSGWGQRTTGGNPRTAQPSSPVLRRLTVALIPGEACSRASGLNVSGGGVLCAGYLEGSAPSCRGDDGSPLVTTFGSTNFLLGVVVWGQGCSLPGYYGVYANMVHYVDWVVDTMKAPANSTASDASPVMFEQTLVGL